MSVSSDAASDSVRSDQSDQSDYSGQKNSSAKPAARFFPGSDCVKILSPNSGESGEDALMAKAAAALEAGHSLLLPAISGIGADEERALKAMALERDLFVFGPGTSMALFGDFSFGIQSAVGRGRGIGVVGTNGGAIHELTSLASDHYGASIAAAIDVGARDLSNRVGGLMTERVLHALAADPEVEVICLAAYRPSEEMTDHLAEVLACLGKPVVVRWIGEFGAGVSKEKDGPAAIPGNGIFFASDIDEAAQAAALLAEHKPLEFRKSCSKCDVCMKAEKLRGGKELPGRLVWIFGNGALASEAAGFLRSRSMKVSMPVFPLSEEGPVEIPGSLVVDSTIGTDPFGTQHPAVSIARRAALVRKAAADKSVGAVFFDVTLGKGAHENPAPLFIEAVRRGLADRYGLTSTGDKPASDEAAPKEEAKSSADSLRDIVVMASITGTAADAQNFAAQKALLREAGIAVAPTSAKAARIASEIFLPR